MNDGNMWNSENSENSDNKNNRSTGFNRSPGNRPKGSRQRQLIDTPSLQGSIQTNLLLEEIVKQNNTIIGILRGIGQSISSKGNPKPAYPSTKKTVTVKITPPVANTAPTSNQPKATPPVAAPEVSPEPKPSQPQRKQFVMRFDDKEPLNLDLEDETILQEEPVSVTKSKRKSESKPEPEPKYDHDENSIGESDPFALFGKYEDASL